ncbi:MAG TPA: M56 family metallopeptidase [Saprospiraceae bacterium]|nr:M56 family metallopeptidase [Saprospiraceae bacterium]
MQALNPQIFKLYYSLSWTFLHSLWQAAVIVLAVSLFLSFLTKTTPETKYKIWLYASILFLSVNSVTFIKLYSTFDQKMDSVSLKVETVPDPINNIAPVANLLNQSVASEPVHNTENISHPLLDYFNSFSQYINTNIHLIMLFWFIGMLAFLVRFLGGLSFVYYIKSKYHIPVDQYWEDLLISLQKKLKITKKIEIVESALVHSVMIIGHLKPMILFPVGWINKLDPQDVEAILLHELAHVSRKDFLVNLIQSVMELIYYFNPMVWFLSSKLREEREHCCDDLAIACGTDPLKYARSLMLLQQMQVQEQVLALGFLGNKKFHLLERVKRMLQPKQEFYTPTERWISLCSVSLVLMALTFTSLNASLKHKADMNPITLNDSIYPLSKIDSFILRKNVPDGVYTFTNNQLTSRIVVKENKVYELNFNGVSVSPENFSKFEDYFYSVLTKKYNNADQSSNEMNSIHSTHDPAKQELELNILNGTYGMGQSHSSENHSDHAHFNSKSIHYVDGYKIITENNSETGETRVRKYKNDELVQDVFNGPDQVYVRDYKNKQIIKETTNNPGGWSLNNHSGSSLKVDSKALEEQCKDLNSGLQKLEIELSNLKLNDKELLIDIDEELQRAMNQITQEVRQFDHLDISNKDVAKIKEKLSQLKKSYHEFKKKYKLKENETKEKWHDALYEKMIELGHIQHGDRLSFQWSNEIMMVNGKKLNQNEYDKVKQLYEHENKTQIEGQFNISVTISR